MVKHDNLRVYVYFSYFLVFFSVLYLVYVEKLHDKVDSGDLSDFTELKL